jgi:hypothetical protein
VTLLKKLVQSKFCRLLIAMIRSSASIIESTIISEPSLLILLNTPLSFSVYLCTRHIFHSHSTLAASWSSSGRTGHLLNRRCVAALTALISTSFCHSISKPKLKHILKVISRAAVEQQVLYHLILMLCYLFFQLNIARSQRCYLSSSFDLARYR